MSWFVFATCLLATCASWKIMDWRNRQSYLELVQSKNNGTETSTNAWDFIVLILFLISLAILLLVSLSNPPKLAETLKNKLKDVLKDKEKKQWKKLFTIPVLVFAIGAGGGACWQYNQLQYHTTADTVAFVVLVCLTVVFAVSKPLVMLRNKHAKARVSPA